MKNNYAEKIGYTLNVYGVLDTATTTIVQSNYNDSKSISMYYFIYANPSINDYDVALWRIRLKH